MTASWRRERTDSLLGFRKLRGHNDKYAYIFVGLKMLNLFIVLFQIYV